MSHADSLGLTLRETRVGVNNSFTGVVFYCVGTCYCNASQRLKIYVFLDLENARHNLSKLKKTFSLCDYLYCLFNATYIRDKDITT